MRNVPALVSDDLIDFLSKRTWYWTTIFLATVASVAIFTISENALPIAYLRSSLAIFLIMFLPGFALIKSLMLTQLPIRTTSKNIDKIELIMLSIGLSISLTSIVGLILNYTPWGVRLTPITLSLMALTVILATVAMLRDFKQYRYANAKLNSSTISS